MREGEKKQKQPVTPDSLRQGSLSASAVDTDGLEQRDDLQSEEREPVSATNVHAQIAEMFAGQDKQLSDERSDIEQYNPQAKENQRRNRSKAIIAAVADGLSALSNVYFASKGAPAATAEAKSISKQQQESNVRDSNRYMSLLKDWRSRNSDYINSYVAWQRARANADNQQQRLDFERSREERLYQQMAIKREYNELMARLKAEGLDETRAHNRAMEMIARDKNTIARINANANKIRADYYASGGSDYTTETDYDYNNKGELIGKTTTRTYNGK